MSLPLQVEVKFDIDANGILSVTATDKGSGKKQDIKITGASTLGKDDVERMVTCRAAHPTIHPVYILTCSCHYITVNPSTHLS